MQEFLNQTFWGNTIQSYLIALGIFIIGVLIVKVLQKIVLFRLKKWAAKTETTIDDLLIKSIEKSIIPLLFYAVFYSALHSLALSESTAKILKVVSLFIITFFIVRFISSTIMFTITYFIRKQERGEEKARQLRGMTVLINIFVWVVGFVFLMDNLGFDISAVIAGLGIGGIAIALAAQTILGDLFSYFVIFFDRPFEVGDFITVQDKSGTVEYTGIKTTRLRSLSGEQLVFSNHDLTNSRIHNYKKMERRRVVFTLRVIYQTTAEQIESIPKLVREIIESQQDVAFDRGHFASYGDFSLNFEFVYFVLEADYNKYMNIQQAINMKIYDTFEQRGIGFAYPTQTLYLNKEEKTQN
ncbi:MAG: mechanosensitive ion channel family protein [Ignavibacteriota bacterium]|nr:MAG: mechanosensitive ion channel family protein [Chlorobiota bacterium]MBE7475895.1 mechanosensitive ion channel family protein [Ignavibacteriales bacterium]MBL1123296.1 mechanosensitive ion channel family protein [Ignavibacteriota bacterium]MCC7094877.1 mechanosensitive ion channel family protein [Ignavibacteriaceae bacterium]MCE7857093.1 mechanosensitive ion channel family protein [Ignavibacteria bacterium CHB3]